MLIQKRGNWWLTVIVVMLALPCRLVPYNGGSQQKVTKQSAEIAAPQDDEYHKVDPSYYVGAETCKGCHEDLGPGFDRGPHRKSTLPQRQGPQWQGCEACHGPGKEHAESGDPDKIVRLSGLSREESSKRCLGCHQFSQEHANFLRSRHLKNNVGCTDCHSMHHPAVERKLLKVAQPDLCLRCHSQIKSDTSNSFHQSLNQRAANCTQCHNPHGAARPQATPH